MLIGTVLGLTDNEDLYGDNSMDMLHGDNKKVVQKLGMFKFLNFYLAKSSY